MFISSTSLSIYYHLSIQDLGVDSKTVNLRCANRYFIQFFSDWYSGRVDPLMWVPWNHFFWYTDTKQTYRYHRMNLKRDWIWVIKGMRSHGCTLYIPFLNSGTILNLAILRCCYSALECNRSRNAGSRSQLLRDCLRSARLFEIEILLTTALCECCASDSLYPVYRDVVCFYAYLSLYNLYA